MIYLQNTTEQQGAFFPHCFTPVGAVKLTARCTSNPSAPSISVTASDYTSRRFYLFLFLALPQGCETGEYDYILEDEERRLDCGVLVVGEYSRPTEYKEETIQYGAN